MKLRLTVLNGSIGGQVFELETGHLLIGRSANCSVKFDPRADSIVSSQHAFIYATDDGFHIRDNESTNGTYLNGVRITEAKLGPGDIVTFGRNGIEARIDIVEQVPAFTGAVPGEPAPTEESFVPIPAPTTASAFEIETEEMFRREPANFGQTMTGLGLSAPSVKLPPPQTGMYVAVGIMSILIILAVLPMLLLIVAGLGPVATVIATFTAFLPVALYLAPLLWLDRYDPEPFWLLILCFAWGGVVAILTSAIVNDVFTYVAAEATRNAILGQLAGAVISAPFIEELMKGIGLLAMLLFFRRKFDDILDGIVFAGVIALGFATVENVLFYGRELLTAGFGGLLWIFLLRGILSPFAHVTFTMMTGIGCGISRESHNWIVRLAMPLVGLGAAMFLHAVWNGMSVAILYALYETGGIVYCDAVGLGGEEAGICAFFIGYTVLEIPVFLIFVAFSLFIMRRQSRTLKEMLAIDVARGLIEEEHLKIATSLFRSIFWPLGGITSGKFLNRRRYLRAIGSLGLSYWHIQRATKAQGHTASFQTNPYLRGEVERLAKLV
ncbi:MAG TPA: PrsW family glutamic-type intramembrane protease [Aridibacter sp.]|nr:PrsW family glutamic-type intramembrane protease [Aridibacter sp.]